MKTDKTLSAVEISFDELSHEQAIELLKLQSWDLQQRDQLENALVDKLVNLNLSEDQHRELYTFMHFSIETRQRFILSVQEIVGPPASLN